MGLRDSAHIGRVVIHPHNPDIVFVAALGHVFGPNKERGLYRTDDGGKTWQKLPFIDSEDTGFIDLAMDPDDPTRSTPRPTPYGATASPAATRPVSSAPTPASTRPPTAARRGSSMTKGLPTRPYGRCGLSVYRKDPRIVYAVVSTDKTDIHNVPGQPPKTNDQPETGGVFRSDDRGETWVKVNDLCPRPFYFGQIRVDPNDDQRVYVAGVPLFASADGGKTFAQRRRPRRPRRPPRPLDRPRRFRPPGPRHRRRPLFHLRPRRPLAASGKPADRPVLRHRPRHCASRTASTAACRTTAAGAAPAGRATPTAITVADWFKIYRGRRLLLPAGPRRPRHRLLRGPVRRSAARQRPPRRRYRRRPAAADPSSSPRPPSPGRGVQGRPTASTGTRRS